MNIENFNDVYDEGEVHRIISKNSGSIRNIVSILEKDRLSFNDLASLLSSSGMKNIELIAQRARKLTTRRFGSNLLLYVPLYLSSYCSNECLYCGFNSENEIKRKFINKSEFLEEIKILKNKNFSHILIVSSEDRRHFPPEQICDFIKDIKDELSSISIEIYPLKTREYSLLRNAGVDGVTLYQETYAKKLYKKYHRSGSKSDYFERLSAADRIGKAGIRKINIGALLGLYEWRFEILSVALHAIYLKKKYWRSEISISFPRIKNAPTGFKVAHPVSDRELVLAITALRCFLPDVNFVMSTREEPSFRDNMIGLGITQISAGSRTSPGGYFYENEYHAQFEIEDSRSVEEVVSVISEKGYNPVWKDWESFL